MRLNRFALVAGVLALGVAACGDDVQVVEPTPPVAPPPPPVEATMAPASASVAVGSNVVFAVTASGGVSGEAASWTCASSNTGIATVSVVSAGCQATGVAAGSVTITAAVSKSGETVNVGAELTVTDDAEPTQPPGDPAFILIGTVSDATPDVGTLSRRVNVVVDVERGGQTLEDLRVTVDGEVVASQSFGSSMDMTPPPQDDGPAEQAANRFTLSFDSHEYGEDGSPRFANGERTIQAELQIAGGMMPDGMMGHETVLSNAVPVEFDNADGIHVTATAPGDGAMDSAGQIWYGGPGTALEIAAVPVMYSGGSLASITLLAFCGADAISDAEAPYEFAPDCEDEGETNAGVTPTFTGAVAGAAVDLGILNDEDDIFPIWLDYTGPGAPVFRVNRNSRQDGWINGTLALTSTSGRNPNSWLRRLSGPAARGTGGVGGATTQLRVGGDFDEALAAEPSSSPTLPEASRNNDDYCFIASAVDDLGNESVLPDEDDGSCAADDDYADKWSELSAILSAVSDAGGDPTDAQQEDIDDLVDDLEDMGLQAGVDVEAPAVSFTTNPSSPVRSAREFQVQASDAGRGRSGIHPTPVLARVELRNADGDVLCGSDIRTEGEEDDSNTETIPGDPDEDCENTSGQLTVTGAGGAALLATTAVFATGASAYNEIGYYTFTAQARDKAGNLSDEINRVHLNDTEGPSVGITARVPSGGFDGPFDVTVLMADDLSLRDIRADGSYGTTHTIRLIESQRIDGFNAPQLTQEHVLQLSDVETLLRLHDTPATFTYVDAGGSAITAPAKEPVGVVAAADEISVPFPAADIDLTSIGVRLRDQSGASATDNAMNLTVASSVNPFDYALPAIPAQEADDAATDDVNEGTVSKAARDVAVDEWLSVRAAKEIAAFVITRFEGNAPVTGTPGPAEASNVVADNDVTIDIEVQVHGNARGGTSTAVAADADPLLDFENPFERVDLYVADGGDVLHLVASAVGFSGEYSIDENRGTGDTSNTEFNDDQRVWTYEIEVSADALNGLSRGSSRGTIDRTLRAFGVTGRGTTALVSGDIPVRIESR